MRVDANGIALPPASSGIERSVTREIAKIAPSAAQARLRTGYIASPRRTKIENQRQIPVLSALNLNDFRWCHRAASIAHRGSLIIICALVPLLLRAFVDVKPNIQLTAEKAQPRTLEDTTQKAVLRDYTAAWQAVEAALANNSAAPLADNFAGFALEKLTQRIKEQRSAGLKTRIVDHGHHVEAIFYSRDGSAMELRDTASIETQVLDGSTVIHSDNAQIQYLVVMTGAADRWQVRVLEEGYRE